MREMTWKSVRACQPVALSASWENPKACLVLVPATDCVILNVVVGKPRDCVSVGYDPYSK